MFSPTNGHLTMRPQSIFAVALSVALASCAHAPSAKAPLVGTWAAISQNAAGSSFEFRPDKSATWRLGQPFEIEYEVDDQSEPTKLDLFGFQTGPLKGRTLFCLIEISESMLRMDCEPTERPSSFNPEQTQAFSRGRDGA